jgi:multisubunit Na+/H+ antiporter MnhC subunit
MQVALPHFLVVGALLFSLGLVTVATRRNAVGVLMGVELILNGANVNFAAFNHYVVGGVSSGSPPPGRRWAWPSSSRSSRPSRPSTSAPRT